jgi:hypothetical protein
MKYSDYKRNHAVLPERISALETFLRQDYGALKQHKWNNGFSSNSEDALTWSCFDVLKHLPHGIKIMALDEILEDAYQREGMNVFKKAGYRDDQIQIHIGKQYTGLTEEESTEVDASIEVPGKLIFFEAKLYSTVSMASPPEKPYDQIARKLRIGLHLSSQDNREFFFIFLDIAPLEKLLKRKTKTEALVPSKSGYDDKWKSAWWFDYYKRGRNQSLSPLKKVLKQIATPPVQSIADNMGWLTWSDLFKVVLRGMIRAQECTNK